MSIFTLIFSSFHHSYHFYLYILFLASVRSFKDTKPELLYIDRHSIARHHACAIHTLRDCFNGCWAHTLSAGFAGQATKRFKSQLTWDGLATLCVRQNKSSTLLTLSIGLAWAYPRAREGLSKYMGASIQPYLSYTYSFNHYTNTDSSQSWNILVGRRTVPTKSYSRRPYSSHWVWPHQ